MLATHRPARALKAKDGGKISTCPVMSNYMVGEMGEKEKWKDSCAVERGRTEGTKAVSSRLIQEDCLPPGAMVAWYPDQGTRK